MEEFPLNILINIFSYVDCSASHLISKLFREISILTMTSKQCCLRMQFNEHNETFLYNVLRNKNAWKRSPCNINNSLNISLSCIEIWFQNNIETQTIVHVKYFITTFNISDLIFNKLLHIAILYNCEDIVSLMLNENRRLIDLRYMFMIAYEHQYTDIVKLIFDYKDINGKYILFNRFDRIHREQFQRKFIDLQEYTENFTVSKHWHLTFKVFEYFKTSDILKNICEQINSIVVPPELKIFDIPVVSNSILLEQLTQKWNQKKIKSMYLFINVLLNRSVKTIGVKCLKQEEFEIFNILKKHHISSLVLLSTGIYLMLINKKDVYIKLYSEDTCFRQVIDHCMNNTKYKYELILFNCICSIPLSLNLETKLVNKKAKFINMIQINRSIQRKLKKEMLDYLNNMSS